ncbi:hypothetical protein DFJ74DRAFT_650022 [Hyaloraphidium curvatum]|nr:hypothetical protein DFJ74DRAFT_650022 [Hyaloraphidium curvatum]
MATIDHTIAPGDTFTKLAERYQTTVDAIVKANPGVKPEALQVGQVVKIPRSGDPGVTNPPPTVPGGPDQEAIDAAGHAQLDADIKRYQETLAKNTPPNPTDMDEVKKVQIESAQVFEKACQNPALIDHANDGKRYVAEAMMTLDNAMHAKLDTDTQDILQKVAAAGSDTTAIYRCKDEAAKAVEAPLQNESVGSTSRAVVRPC